MKRKLPSHIPGTIRAFRLKKRRQLQLLQEALWAFRFGSAYVPSYNSENMQTVSTILTKFKQEMSQKNWGK